MAVERAVKVDIEKYTSSYQGAEWYKQKIEAVLKGNTVEFGSTMKISLDDLRTLLNILDDPNRKAKTAWDPNMTSKVYRNA